MMTNELIEAVVISFMILGLGGQLVVALKYWLVKPKVNRLNLIKLNDKEIELILMDMASNEDKKGD